MRFTLRQRAYSEYLSACFLIFLLAFPPRYETLLDVVADPPGEANPFDNAFISRPPASRPRSSPWPTLTCRRAVPGDRQSFGPQRSRQSHRLQVLPATTPSPSPGGAGAQASSTITSGSRRITRTNALPPAIISIKAAPTRASKSGSRPTAPSKTPTSSSGAPSATSTYHAPEDCPIMHTV